MRTLVRNPGPVVDPDLVWWHSRGPGAVQREPAAELVVRRRIRDENTQVLRYMWLLEHQYSNLWSIIQRNPNPRMSYDPVRVPALWTRCAPRTRPRRLGPGRTD